MARVIVAAGSYDWQEFIEVYREDQKELFYSSVADKFDVDESLAPGSEEFWGEVYDYYNNTKYKAFSAYWLDTETLEIKDF